MTQIAYWPMLALWCLRLRDGMSRLLETKKWLLAGELRIESEIKLFEFPYYK